MSAALLDTNASHVVIFLTSVAFILSSCVIARRLTDLLIRCWPWYRRLTTGERAEPTTAPISHEADVTIDERRQLDAVLHDYDARHLQPQSFSQPATKGFVPRRVIHMSSYRDGQR